METENKNRELNVFEFTEYPGPRYIDQGDDSGESFYYNILKPVFQSLHDSDQKMTMKLVVNLDNTAGYASSFLDEAFGNLAYDFGQEEVLNRLEIISNQEPDWISVIKSETIPEWHKKKLEGIPRKSL